MKKLLVLLALSAIMASAAFAAADPDPDGIGVYFDDAAEMTSTAASPMGLLVCNLCVTNPSGNNGVSGFEGGVNVIGNYIALQKVDGVFGNVDFGASSGPTNVDWRAGAGVGALASYADVNGVVLVGQFQFYPMDTNPIEIFAAPGNNPSIPGVDYAMYADALDAGNLIPLQAVSGGYDLPVARVNGDAVVDNGDQSWGSVKALF